MPLNKFLAHGGVCSRRKAVDLITSGSVTVNGNVVIRPGLRVDPDEDVIKVDGRGIKKTEFVYVLLNKPAGAVSTASDEQGRITVTDLVKTRQRLYPVGRLDRDTEGVLLLTNDGELAFRLTHPRFKINKIYKAKVEGIPDGSALKRLKQGVRIEGGRPVKAEASLLYEKGGTAGLKVVIHEGRKRQVRKMLEAIGHPVLHLERIQFAGLTANGLERGGWRFLKNAEVKRLYGICGLESD